MQVRKFRWLATVAWCVFLCAGAAEHAVPLIGSAALAPDKATMNVGLLTLRRCAWSEGWCGTLGRALDPDGRVPGRLPIYFEFYPHRDSGPSRGTLVAAEGGPGYPATESRQDYLALFEPLRGSRDVVLMDNRGTGRSAAIDCPDLQHALAITEANVAACGTALGARAPFYGTVLAADDLAALLEALGAGRIDLYGDSDGTFFSQVFAVRHPERLRSLVLDGAFPLGGAGYAWYPAYAPAMRAKFDIACARSSACNNFPGSSLSHIEPALQMLRERPTRAQAQNLSGKLQHFTANATQLAIVMFGGALARATLREMDAAARAFVAGDRLPLLRLMAETHSAVDSRDSKQLSEKFSAGYGAAAMCQDHPQIFNMSLVPDQRIADRERVIAQRKAVAPNTYEPFTIDECRGMPLDCSFIDQCVRWPALSADRPALQWIAGTVSYPDVPVLVVSGELDNMTPAADAAAAAAHYPRAHHLLIRNGLHVDALPKGRGSCAASVVRRFLETLDVGDTSCVTDVPEVRLVPRFARHVTELEPAQARAGNVADPMQLSAVSAAVLAMGDALVRAPDIASGDGVGLRGGSFSVFQSHRSYRLELRGLRWTDDLAVTGIAEAPFRSGAAHAVLQLRGALELSGRLEVDWHEGESLALASVRGTLGGRVVLAELAAP